MADPEVHIAETEREKEAIYRLRYEVYVEEMGGGLRHREADVAARQLRDELDERAHHFYVKLGDRIVACARLNLRRDGPLECEEQVEMGRFAPDYPDRVSMCSRLALRPDLRGSHLLRRLVREMYRFGREHDIRFDFLDCHPRLLPLYSRLGYRVYRPGFKHPRYVYVIPMVLVTDDLDYLQQVNSPFLSLARRYPHSTAGRARLLAQFPEAELTFVSPQLDATAFWDLLRRRHLDPGATIDRYEILSGLTEEEKRLVISVGHLVACRGGDAVLSQGDPGREVFIILEGSFEVLGRFPGEERLKVIKILGPGDVFGEVGFLTDGIRATSVTAMEDAVVLVLNAKGLDRLLAAVPSVAAKVFRSLARILAVRLRDTLGF